MVYHEENQLNKKMRVVLITLFLFLILGVVVVEETDISKVVNPAQEGGTSDPTKEGAY